MYKFRCLVCLMLLCELGFGSQPDECLFKKQHLVISLDWHKEISKPSSIASNKYYFFNRGISNLTLNDTTHMQGLQTDASRVTFGKIALESLGATAGGAFSGYACAKIVGDQGNFWQGAAVFIGVATGAAGGTTFVGNLLMEPNGSFTKSIIGSTAGTGLSAGLLVLIALAYWEKGSAETDWTLYYVGPSLAALLPVVGAVVGYNHNISRKSVVPMMNSPEENEFLDGGSQRHYPLIKCQIITIKLPWVSK